MSEKILLSHGAGGRMTHELVESMFLKNFRNDALEKLDDAALLDIEPGRIAFTTDAFVVKPVFFPGGDIGKLAVCGTVNDLAVMGAKPIALSAAVIIEEGFETLALEKIVLSMRDAAASAGVNIVCGDTKVVEKGGADGIFIATAGIGVLRSGSRISGRNAGPGDCVILSGTIGDHGISVLQARGEYELEGIVQSDCAPLNGIIKRLLDICPEVRVLRDPTRGGLATTLNEIAKSSGVRVEIFENALPVLPSVKTACGILGIDPLYVANEGKFVAFLPDSFADQAVLALKEHPLGRNTVKIGRVIGGKPGVEMVTSIGGRRPLRMLEGEQLPRIC